jgi:hypothetical protein
MPQLQVPSPPQPSGPPSAHAAAASPGNNDDQLPAPCATLNPALILFDSDYEVLDPHPRHSRLFAFTSLVTG